MRRLALFAAFSLALAATPSAADDCLDSLRSVVTGSMQMKPSEGHLISETEGMPRTENGFFIASAGHMLFKPIDPPDLPWTLTYVDASYVSSDEGKTWTLGYSFDPDAQAEASAQYVQTLADSAVNAVCSSETVDGRALDVMEADMSTTGDGDLNYHAKYWYDPAIEMVVKSVSTSKMAGLTSTVTQTWAPAAGLELPTPTGGE